MFKVEFSRGMAEHNLTVMMLHVWRWTFYVTLPKVECWERLVLDPRGRHLDMVTWSEAADIRREKE